MISLAKSKSAAVLLPFVSYCQQQQWQVRLEPLADQSVELWVAEQDADVVAMALHAYLQQPADEKYQAAAWQQAELAPTSSSGFGLPHGIWQQLGLGTRWLTVITALVYVCQWLWPVPTLRGLVLLPETSWLSWRWLTPVFLHFSLEHLLMNLSVLLTIGSRIEQRLGWHGWALLVLVTGIVGNVAQYQLVGPAFGGLSGIGFGLIGFYALAGWRFPSWQFRLGRANLVLALVFLLLGFADLLWVNVANWAHLGGLLAGLLAAAVWPSPRRY